ncbi:MAG: hypothetical protein ACRD5J_18600 [Nitrososphaeraceae archaeon]
MKKRTIIIIAIIAAIIVGFGVWAITPYFTNTTIDEPLPTSFESFSNEERLVQVSYVNSSVT